MKSHKIGLLQLVLLGLGSLIGSGWLFGSWEATRVAGPAAIISWVIGAVVIGVIAYTYIELGTMFPQSGECQSSLSIPTVHSWALLLHGRTGSH